MKQETMSAEQAYRAAKLALLNLVNQVGALPVQGDARALDIRNLLRDQLLTLSTILEMYQGRIIDLHWDRGKPVNERPDSDLASKQ